MFDNKKQNYPYSYYQHSYPEENKTYNKVNIDHNAIDSNCADVGDDPETDDYTAYFAYRDLINYSERNYYLRHPHHYHPYNRYQTGYYPYNTNFNNKHQYTYHKDYFNNYNKNKRYKQKNNQYYQFKKYNIDSQPYYSMNKLLLIEKEISQSEPLIKEELITVHLDFINESKEITLYKDDDHISIITSFCSTHKIPFKMINALMTKIVYSLTLIDQTLNSSLSHNEITCLQEIKKIYQTKLNE